MIMEADKTQDLQRASWRPRRADAVVLVWVPGKVIVEVPVWMLTGSRPKKSQCFSTSPKAKKKKKKTNVPAQ